MAVCVKILREQAIRLWGLTSRERLARMLAKAGVKDIQDHFVQGGNDDSVLLLRGDVLYDQRIIKQMANEVGIVLEQETPEGRVPVAAHVTGELADRMEAVITAGQSGDYPDSLRCLSAEELVPGFQKELLKFDPPYILPISDNNRRSLEKRLFDGSYKGVTDLVTKWLWPMPARHATRLCTHYGIVPNQVTSLSLVLSILAGGLFYFGWYATGLVAAWLMTFLDTVDGKLARVTLNYSTFGNIFDHAIDLIFPPLWYLAWGMSLPSIPGVSHEFAYWSVMGGYVVGRLVEITFTKLLDSSGIFCWKPIDSCFRLITGRRNPNLILLTASLLFARPDIGFLAVCLWTVLSSLFLIARLIQGIHERFTSGPLRSWFLDVDPANDKLTTVQRWFYRRPKVANDGHA